VEAVLVDDAAYAAGLVEHAGMPKPAANAYATFGRGARQGYIGVLSDAVQELTGAAPRSVREVLAAELAQGSLA
jgi:NAD(P)H dehydrogenase (quinone)